MNRKLALFGIVLFVSLFISISLPIVAEARTADNVYGWAWSSNIGWIKFNNCSNPRVPSSCNGPDFGVNKNLNNTLTGYAWSSNIGWIRFGLPADSTGRLLGGVPAGGAINYNAEIIGVSDLAGQHTYQLSGWARACSVFLNGCEGNLKPNEQRGGWDGWISLRGSYPNYQVTKISASDELDVLSGFTWGSTVLGWIKFDPLTATLMAQANTDCPGVCIVPPSTATLDVNKYGTGAGTVTSSDGKINCGADCVEDYTVTTPVSMVTLTAAALSGSRFDGWGDASKVDTNSCTVTGGSVRSSIVGSVTTYRCEGIPLSVSKTIHAQFTLLTSILPDPTVNITIDGKGAVREGFVTRCSNITGTTPVNCSLTYSPGTRVSYTAVPGTGASFSRWSGDCSGTGMCSLNGFNALFAGVVKNITATFSGGGTGSCEIATFTCTKTTKQGYSYPCSDITPKPTIKTAESLSGVPPFNITAAHAGMKLQVSEDTTYPVPYYPIFEAGSGDRLIGEFSTDNGQNWSEGSWTSTNDKLSVIFQLRLTRATSSLNRRFNLTRSVGGRFCELSTYSFVVDTERVGTKAIP